MATKNSNNISIVEKQGSRGPRGANGGGSIRQRPDGRWEARVTIGADPATGNQIRRSIYGKTQKEVRQQMNEIIHNLDRGVYQAPTKIKVSAWFDDWLETYAAGKVKPLTYQSYQASIKNHVKPHIGSLELQKVRGSHIQKIYNAMTKAGLSGKTVKNVGAIMHKAFSVAVKEGIIPTNPVDAAELPKVKTREMKPLADDEIPVFLSAIDDSPMRNAYALCLFAGLREAECLGLSWKNVNFKDHEITICQQLQKNKTGDHDYFISDSTKSGKSRTIAPPAIAFEYLKDEQIRQLENRLKAGKDWSNEDDLVFTDEIGKHLAFFTFYNRFKRIAASIGRPDLRPHDLRHTCVTVALANNANPKAVQQMLGHATASFTLNVYGHSTEQMMKDTADRVQGYYDTLKNHG